MTENKFGNNLKTLRKQKGLTQLDLSELLDVSVMTIRRFEAGTRVPKLYMVEKIANIFNVSPSSLIFDEPLKSIYEVEEAIKRNQRIFSKNPTNEDLEYIINSKRNDTISKYDSLNALGQQKANEYITDLSEQEKYTKPDEE